MMAGPTAIAADKSAGSRRAEAGGRGTPDRGSSRLAGVLDLHRALGNARFGAAVRAPETLPSSVDSVVRSAGEPLAPKVRAFMEERFGRDLGDVRVHTGPAADASAADVAAKAYTVGRHIVFRAGEYAPDTVTGRRSLGHELAHVVQQSRGGGPAPGFDADHGLEHAADKAADGAVTNGGGPVQVSGTSATCLARQEDESRRRPPPDPTGDVKVVADKKAGVLRVYLVGQGGGIAGGLAEIKPPSGVPLDPASVQVTAEWVSGKRSPPLVTLKIPEKDRAAVRINPRQDVTVERIPDTSEQDRLELEWLRAEVVEFADDLLKEATGNWFDVATWMSHHFRTMATAEELEGAAKSEQFQEWRARRRIAAENLAMLRSLGPAFAGLTPAQARVVIEEAHGSPVRTEWERAMKEAGKLDEFTRIRDPRTGIVVAYRERVFQENAFGLERVDYSYHDINGLPIGRGEVPVGFFGGMKHAWKHGTTRDRVELVATGVGTAGSGIPVVGDLVALGGSVVALGVKPSVENAIGVGLDAAGAVVPGLPALGTVRRGEKIADAATDVNRIAGTVKDAERLAKDAEKATALTMRAEQKAVTATGAPPPLKQQSSGPSTAATPKGLRSWREQQARSTKTAATAEQAAVPKRAATGTEGRIGPVAPGRSSATTQAIGGAPPGKPSPGHTVVQPAPASASHLSTLLSPATPMAAPKASKGPKVASKGPKVAPKGPKVAPKGPKTALKAPKGPKVAPKGSKVAPKGSKVAPKGSKVAPKGSKVAPYFASGPKYPSVLETMVGRLRRGESEAAAMGTGVEQAAAHKRSRRGQVPVTNLNDIEPNFPGVDLIDENGIASVKAHGVTGDLPTVPQSGLHKASEMGPLRGGKAEKHRPWAAMRDYEREFKGLLSNQKLAGKSAAKLDEHRGKLQDAKTWPKDLPETATPKQIENYVRFKSAFIIPTQHAEALRGWMREWVKMEPERYGFGIGVKPTTAQIEALVSRIQGAGISPTEITKLMSRALRIK